MPRTVLLDVAVKDKSPQRAADIANTVAAQFIAVAGTLETPVGQTEPRTAITIVNDADPPSSPSYPKLWTEVLYGGLGGLAVGLVAVGLCRRVRKGFAPPMNSPRSPAYRRSARSMPAIVTARRGPRN